MNKPPTPEQLVQIKNTLRREAMITAVDVSTVVFITNQVLSEEDREAVYRIEEQIIRAYPDLRFDFRTVVQP